ncbi:hypothetical protein AC579_1125 [Pseudocercospora musae]|uniref:Uncharacterized protein n=1 Tax=Pseudocercospora musae TaxID=113226 RepID=A0A139GSY1_9PEZI|nr:hypothetical protein AC579_1125 [Pseudocercospora musae]
MRLFLDEIRVEGGMSWLLLEKASGSGPPRRLSIDHSCSVKLRTTVNIKQAYTPMPPKRTRKMKKSTQNGSSLSQWLVIAFAAVGIVVSMLFFSSRLWLWQNGEQTHATAAQDPPSTSPRLLVTYEYEHVDGRIVARQVTIEDPFEET